MKIFTWTIAVIIVLAVIGFVIFGYSGYFKIEQAEVQTSKSALDSAKAVKSTLEARDLKVYNSIQTSQ